MNAAERNTLRAAIDQARRAKLETPPRPTVCRSCHCSVDALTHGCRTCARRHARRTRQERA